MFTGWIDSSVWILMIPVALLALTGLFPAQHYIHIFQLESYKRPQFFMRLKEDKSYQVNLGKYQTRISCIQCGILIVFALPLVAIFHNSWKYCISSLTIAAIVSFVALFLRYRKWKRQPSKKPLKVTTRVTRLNVTIGLLLVVAQLLLFVLLLLLLLGMVRIMSALGYSDFPAPNALLTIFVFLSFSISVLYLPRLLALASILVQPVETAVKNWYLNDAKKKLVGFKDMVKIGITGSYGKTSAKVILATILAEKYNTYATPHSYNTPMGVTRAIREQLDASYHVFIAEMGARHVGDIAEMCDLVQPKYGLLTSVGPQHLETFFTIENVAKTKYELIEALPPDGMGFFPCDNEICLELYKKTEKPKALFGFDGCGAPLYMTARDITHGPAGSTFQLCGPDGSCVQCTTRLLGKHNVQNILGCASVAHALGLTFDEIASGIAKVQPVEHRLQLVPTTNGVTVIDDAFNSNPAGARAALEVLKSFPGRKIIVTPGLVELGDAEAQENEAFGRAMVGSVDIAILVARNAEAIKKGLLEAGFDEDNLIVTGRLTEATAAMGSLTRIGDVILFENDLPDHYET